MNIATKIRIALMEAGTSQAQIARECRVHRSMVNHIVQGRRSHKAIERYIEDKCGKGRGELFDQIRPIRSSGSSRLRQRRKREL